MTNPDIFAALVAQIVGRPTNATPAPTSDRAPAATPDPFATTMWGSGSATPGRWRAGDDLGTMPMRGGAAAWRTDTDARAAPAPAAPPPPPAVRPPPTLDHAAYAQRRRGR